LQNHDQVANAARGLRTHLLTAPGRHRALTALLLLGPQTPLLFMGQEFGASSPFLYFADHEPELAVMVRNGRREFMGQFPRVGDFDSVSPLLDPADPKAFNQCKLDWDEIGRNNDMMNLHRDLIRLRREDDVFSRQDQRAIEGAVAGPEAFLLRWFDPFGDDRLALFNLGRDIDFFPPSEPLIAPPADRHWTLIWSSEDPRYGGMGTPAFDEKAWRIPGPAAVVLRAEFARQKPGHVLTQGDRIRKIVRRCHRKRGLKQWLPNPSPHRRPNTAKSLTASACPIRRLASTRNTHMRSSSRICNRSPNDWTRLKSG
jgi:maltooligosyltrehalose trehalohydrolase